MTYEATVLTTAGDVAQFKAGAVVLLQGQSALDVPVNFSVATSKFTVNASTGAAVFAGAVSGITTLGVSSTITQTGTSAGTNIAYLGQGNYNSSVFLGANLGANAGRFTFLTNNGGYNWEISSNWYNANVLEITPSTASGGGTFTTPVVTVARTGLTVAGAITATLKASTFNTIDQNAIIANTTWAGANQRVLLGITKSGAGSGGLGITATDDICVIDKAGTVIGTFSSTGLSVTGGLSAVDSVTVSGNRVISGESTNPFWAIYGFHLGGSNTAPSRFWTSSGGASSTPMYIGNASINTTSDVRLKENVVPSTRNAVDLLNQWEIVDHTWNDPTDQSENNKNSRGVWTGVIAQQVQPITPWIVNKPLTDTDENGGPNYWFMDYGYAVPLVVKAIQELAAKVAALEAK